VIPGKTYTAEDVIDIAKRRKWLIIVPFVLTLSAAVIIAHRTPNQYKSETLILVVPQRISESYVRSTVSGRIEDRLQSISQQILSRTRLEKIILEFDLYAQDRKRIVMENIVEMMRKDITVETVKGDAFRVSYVSGVPEAAMNVTSRLATLFIQENLRDREVLAEDTNKFLQSQLQDARQRLAEREKMVEEYRRRYAGELPTQVESNMQVIQNTQLQVAAVVQSLDRDRDRRLMLERSIVELTRDTPDIAAPAAAAVPGETSLADQLTAAQVDLRLLLARLTPEHPDVGAAKRKVRDLQVRIQNTPSRPPAPAPVPAPVLAASEARLRRLHDVEADMKNLDRQLASKEAEEARLRRVIATYQARVEAAPTRESELIELTRDYNTLQQLYASLLAKSEDSKIATNLERRQNGEQFRVLDAARLPERPFRPNRMRLHLMGALGGLALGLGLAGLFEYRDTTLRSDDDVVTTVGLPVLAMIPMMVTTAEERMRLRKRWLLVGSAAVALLLGTAAVLWKAAAQ
jgi:polysaccharide chain length determinant protein (PEP-CTERM system associated)